MNCSSLPSDSVVTCLINTTVILKRTQYSSETLTPPPPILSLHCPLPGLSECYRVLVTSILYHRIFQQELDSGSLRLFKGILITGDHGLGKSAVVPHFIS